MMPGLHGTPLIFHFMHFHVFVHDNKFVPSVPNLVKFLLSILPLM